MVKRLDIEFKIAMCKTSDKINTGFKTMNKNKRQRQPRRFGGKKKHTELLGIKKLYNHCSNQSKGPRIASSLLKIKKYIWGLSQTLNMIWN